MKSIEELLKVGSRIETIRDVTIPIFFPAGVRGHLIFVPDEGTLDYKLYDSSWSTYCVDSHGKLVEVKK